MTEDPRWLVAGARVAVIGGPLSARVERITMHRISRLTKRDVVLENGDRFSRSRLTRQVGGSYGPSYRLADAADDLVQAGHSAQRKRDRRHSTAVKVQDLMAKWDRTNDDAYARTAATLIDEALSALAGAL